MCALNFVPAYMGCLILNTLGSFQMSAAVHQLQRTLEQIMSFCVVCSVINVMILYMQGYVVLVSQVGLIHYCIFVTCQYILQMRTLHIIV